MSSSSAHRLFVPVLGFGLIVAFASSYYLLGVLAEPLAAGTGTAPSLVFAGLSGAFLISAGLSPFGGRWVDRRGGREVLAVSSVVFALALGGLGLAQGPVSMVASILMLGVGMGVGFYGPAFAVLVAIHGEDAKKPITAVSLIGAFGGALGWPLTLAMIEAVGWRGACFGWAALHLLVCLPLYLTLLPDGRAGPRPSAEAGGVRWDGRMIRLAVLFAGAWWIATALSAHLPRLLGRLGLDPAEAALAASLMAGSAVVVRLLSFLAPGKGSPVSVLRLATLLHPLGAAVAWFGGKGLAGAVALGQGAGNGLLSVASGVLPLHLFGKENYATRQALILTPARFLQAAAPLSYGVVLDHSAGLALAASSAVCVLMFAMTFGLERRAD
ncbi:MULTISPECIES: MFS transporter [unclassified Brevundimonas]|uniref:MFS transporter n=1 Tax=unclassified Brevundimonas TaxID=2622653 RepID=UPI003F9360F2